MDAMKTPRDDLSHAEELLPKAHRLTDEGHILEGAASTVFSLFVLKGPCSTRGSKGFTMIFTSETGAHTIARLRSSRSTHFNSEPTTFAVTGRRFYDSKANEYR